MPAPSTSPQVDTFVLGPLATNCYVIRDGDDGRCWIVDASFDPHPLISAIRERGLEPERIILTHAHADHISGLDMLRSAFPRTPVAVHPAEAAWLRDPVLNLSAAMGEPIATAPADEMLEGGATLEMGGATWSVLHTPGHSPGSITLHCPAIGAAIVGDTLFRASIGRYDFPTSDGEQLFASIRDQLYALPDETTVHPGHGEATTIGAEKRTNPFVRP